MSCIHVVGSGGGGLDSWNGYEGCWLEPEEAAAWVSLDEAELAGFGLLELELLLRWTKYPLHLGSYQGNRKYLPLVVGLYIFQMTSFSDFKIFKLKLKSVETKTSWSANKKLKFTQHTEV